MAAPWEQRLAATGMPDLQALTVRALGRPARGGRVEWLTPGEIGERGEPLGSGETIAVDDERGHLVLVDVADIEAQ
jgi:hypothetical protein